MTKQLTVYGVLLILTLLSWVILQLNKPEQLIENKKPAHNPDFFSTGYSKVELDEQGHRKSELLADELIHYHDDNTVELINPVMRTFHSDQMAWQINAENGNLSADGNDLFLKGNVIIARNQHSGHRPVSVKTSNLKVKTNQDYAETDAWTEILMPPDRTEGLGMQMYFTKPIHLKLLTKVKGRYELHK